LEENQPQKGLKILIQNNLKIPPGKDFSGNPILNLRKTTTTIVFDKCKEQMKNINIMILLIFYII